MGGDITLRHSDYSYTLNGFSLSSTTARSTALGLRAGYPIGRVMPFVSARIGQGTYDANEGSLDIDTREWGIGAEVALIESVSLLASYDRTTSERRDFDAEADSDAFSIGIGYRF